MWCWIEDFQKEFENEDVYDEFTLLATLGNLWVYFDYLWDYLIYEFNWVMSFQSMIQLWMRLWFKWDLSKWVMIYDHLRSFYEILHIWPLLPNWEFELSIEVWCLISHNWVEGELAPYFWGLFESLNELFL